MSEQLSTKSIRWLKQASYNIGMYPGCHADMAPSAFQKLERQGLVYLYAPHNAAHKARYAITERGAHVLASIPKEKTNGE